MATSVNPFDSTTATVAAPGTSVAPALAVPDNCFSVLVHNQTGDAVYVGLGAAGGPLTSATAITIPNGSAPTLPIGTWSKRCGPINLIFDAVAAGVIWITYFNSGEV